MAHNGLITQNEIARWVAQQIESSADEETQGQTPNQ